METKWCIPSEVLALGIKLPCNRFGLYNITTKLSKNKTEQKKPTPFAERLGENVTYAGGIVWGGVRSHRRIYIQPKEATT